MIKRLLHAFAFLLLRKRPIKITALTVISFFVLHTSFAQQWSIIGADGQLSSAASSYTSIAVLNDVPYVVFVEGASPTFITKIRKRNASTGNWDPVGGDNIGANLVYTKIFLDRNNNLYVTYIDVSNGNKLAVKIYNSQTDVWEAINNNSSNLYVSAGSATYNISAFSSTPRCSMAFDSNNTPYIAFTDGSGLTPYVKMFDGTSWATVGSGAVVPAGIAVGISLVIDEADVPWLAFVGLSATNSTTGTMTLYKYNATAWAAITIPNPITGGTATTAPSTGVRHTNMALNSSGNLAIAYFNTANTNRATVVVFNKTANTWSYSATLSSRDCPNLSLISDASNNLYCSFIDYIASTNRFVARVFKQYRGITTWKELKDPSVTTGIDEPIGNPNIAVGSDTSSAYIVYTKSNSSSISTPIVRFFVQPVTTKAVTNITSTSVTTGGNVISDGTSTIKERGVVYGLNINPTTADTKMIDASGGVGSFTSVIAGLIAATTYHVRAYTISTTNVVTYGSDMQFTTTAPDAGSVIVIDNGTTVTMKNGKVAVTITKSSATITNITYKGQNLLNGGYNGGQLYWSWNMGPYQNPSGCTYSLTADPHNNNFNYAEIKLHMLQDSTATTAALDMDIYYSLPRDTSGVYASATLRHPSSYGHANPGGEWRMAGYPGSTFNWLSVDSARNKLMATNNDWGTPAVLSTSPPENMLLTTGIRKNLYECKYDYSADFGEQDAWGWSSTTDNVGLWMTAPSKEYYNGGPMKRELMCHGSPTILNMLGGQHYGMGDDGGILANETWEKTFGPFLIYCNSVPAGTANAPIVLWQDAVAQAKKEQASWPYSWYTNPSYVQENGRGTITGTLAITDPGAPTASAAYMWVGVAAQPANATTTDFQHWSKNYQFWIKTDANGNFTIPHVLPGTYNFYAFGPGTAGQLTLNNYVTVTAGNTSALGTVNWTPTRTAATVWEIGIPDRSAKEFFHGNDWWVSDAQVNTDSTNWAKFRDYVNEFPSGVNFTIGQSNIATDWNYVMPFDKGYRQSVSPVWTINFNLASAPTAGSTVSLYTALAANFSAALITTVNGTNITNPTSGATFGNKSDAMIRMGIHGAFTDARFNFPASNLHAGANTITFSQRLTGGATTGDLIFDYVRLEADGTGPAVLPVTFGTIQAYKKEQGIQVDWQILTEANIKVYEVERSTDGQAFTNIGTVAAKGNSNIALNYGLFDASPNSGNNFYRIKSIGTDGIVQYSKIVKVVLTGNGNSSLVIYPNPIIGNSITLQLNNFEKGNYVLTLTNQLGQQVFSQNITNNSTATGQNIVLDKMLASGVYQLKLVGNNKVVTQQVVKE